MGEVNDFLNQALRLKYNSFRRGKKIQTEMSISKNMGSENENENKNKTGVWEP
jgi:hypothetical protein